MKTKHVFGTHVECTRITGVDTRRSFFYIVNMDPISDDLRRYVVQLARYTYFSHILELEKKLGHAYKYNDPSMNVISNTAAQFCVSDYRCNEFYAHVLVEIWNNGLMPKTFSDPYFKETIHSEMAILAYDLYKKFGNDYMKSRLWLDSQINEIEIERALI